jgi:SprT-like family
MQRHKGAFGFFSGERFANASDPKEITDEIVLNPVHFATRKPDEVLSTLVHEMVHLWQHHFGEQPLPRQTMGGQDAGNRAHSDGDG